MEETDGQRRAAELAAAHRVMEMARLTPRLGLKVIDLRNNAHPWVEILAALVSLMVPAE
jgi:hypothetical protein